MAALNYCIFPKHRSSLLCRLPTDVGSFIPNVKLMYEDSRSIEADCVNTVVFNLPEFDLTRFCLSDSHVRGIGMNSNADFRKCSIDTLGTRSGNCSNQCLTVKPS